MGLVSPQQAAYQGYPQDEYQAECVPNLYVVPHTVEYVLDYPETGKECHQGDEERFRSAFHIPKHKARIGGVKG